MTDAPVPPQQPEPKKSGGVTLLKAFLALIGFFVFLAVAFFVFILAVCSRR